MSNIPCGHCKTTIEYLNYETWTTTFDGFWNVRKVPPLRVFPIQISSPFVRVRTPPAADAVHMYCGGGYGSWARDCVSMGGTNSFAWTFVVVGWCHIRIDIQRVWTPMQLFLFRPGIFCSPLRLCKRSPLSSYRPLWSVNSSKRFLSANSAVSLQYTNGMTIDSPRRFS